MSTRYRLMVYRDEVEFVECADGEWMRAAQHDAEVARLNAVLADDDVHTESARLKAECETWRKHFPLYTYANGTLVHSGKEVPLSVHAELNTARQLNDTLAANVHHLRSRNEVLEANLADAERRMRLWREAHGDHCTMGSGCPYRDEEWFERCIQEGAR